MARGNSLVQHVQRMRNAMLMSRPATAMTSHESLNTRPIQNIAPFHTSSFLKRPRCHFRNLCSGSTDMHDGDPYVSDYFRLTDGEVESYLNRMRLDYRRTGEFMTVKECPFCHPIKDDPANMDKLTINRSSGYYNCFRCGANGSWFTFKRRMGFNREDITSIGHSKQKSSKSTYHQLDNHSSLVEIQQAYISNISRHDNEARRYLHQRGITDATLKHFGIGSTNSNIRDGVKFENHTCITFPMYDKDDNLVRYKLRSTKTKQGMRLHPKGGEWGFFGLNLVPKEADEIIITEGEIDAMSVYQQTGRHTISLPNGANSLPVSLLPALERFKTIYLWMDEDSVGQAGAEQFSRKLGLRRCLSVRGLTSNGKKYKDANDALQDSINLSEFLDAATVVEHEALLQFDDLRQQVFHELTNAHDTSITQCHTIPKLNQFIKGHRRGELSIFTGHTGVGKTTFLSQLSLDYCRQGVTTLWGSFEIANVRLISRMLRQFAEMENNGRSLIENYDYWADRFSELPIYFMRYHGSNPVDQILDTMEYANYVHDCSHVVLDNLQFLTYGQETKSAKFRFNDKFEVMDNAVAQIRQFCTSRNTHVTLVVHPRKEDDDSRIQTASVFGSAKATQEADNVMILQRTADGPQLEIKKNRHDGNLGSISLKFDPKKLHFYERDSVGVRTSPPIVAKKIHKTGKKKTSPTRIEKVLNEDSFSGSKPSTDDNHGSKQIDISDLKQQALNNNSKSWTKETKKRITFRKAKGERPSIVNEATETNSKNPTNEFYEKESKNDVTQQYELLSQAPTTRATEMYKHSIANDDEEKSEKDQDESNEKDGKVKKGWSGVIFEGNNL